MSAELAEHAEVAEQDEVRALRLQVKTLEGDLVGRNATIQELYRTIRALAEQVEVWDRRRAAIGRVVPLPALRRARAAGQRLAPRVSRLRERARPRPAGGPSPTAHRPRIVIAGPPKAGNTWLKCLLAATYGLRVVEDYLVPRDDSVESFRALVDNGFFPEGSILHQHLRYSDAFAAYAASLPSHVVTIVRDPYDLFVSAYHHVQRMPQQVAEERGRGAIFGKPIDHPDVVRFLEREYGRVLALADEWARSGKSILVRYEELLADPERELGRIAGQIEPVAPGVIGRAVERCTPDSMRRTSAGLAAHVRVATTGDWRNHLTEEHLEVFRRCHAATVRSLGYAVQ